MKHAGAETINPQLEALKEGGWREVASINRALDEGRIDEDGWHEAMASLIKPAYLAGQNPYAQAGHSGDAATWESSRGFIAEAFHRNGTFLIETAPFLMLVVPAEF